MSVTDKIIEETAKVCGISLPTESKYEYAVHTCYKCTKLMIVFDWSNSEIWSNKEPPKPIPKTVQKRHTKTIGESYWANVCPFCDSVQGDWYLNVEPGGVFSGIPDYDDFYKFPEKQEMREIEEKEPEQQNLL